MNKGKSVYLRALTEEDMISIYRACQDEEIIYMTGTRQSFTLDDIIERYKHFDLDDTRIDFAIC